MALGDAFGVPAPYDPGQGIDDIARQEFPDDVGPGYPVDPGRLIDAIARRQDRKTRPIDEPPPEIKPPSSYGEPVEASPTIAGPPPSSFGELVKPPAGPTSISDYPIEFGKGVAVGAKGLPASALKGAAAVYDNGIPATTEMPQYDAMGNVTGMVTPPQAAVAAKPLKERMLYKAGHAIDEFGKDALAPKEGFEGSWTRDLGQGAGSMLAGIPLSMIPGVGPVLSGSLYVGAGMGEAAEKADKNGATNDQINQAAFLGGFAGATDILDNYLPFLKTTGRVLGFFKRVGLAAAKGAALEGGQEGIQQLMQNAIAKGIYKPDQDLFEDVPRSVALAAILGGVAGGAGAAMRGNQEHTTTTYQDAPQPAPADAPGLPPGGNNNTNNNTGNTGGAGNAGAGPGGPGAGPGNGGAGTGNSGGPGPQPNTGPGGAGAQPGAQPGPQPGPPPGTGTGKGPEFTMDARTRAKMEKHYRHFEPNADIGAMADHELFNALNDKLRDTSNTGHTAKPETPEEVAAREEAAADRMERAFLVSKGWPETLVRAMTPEQRRAKYQEASGARPQPKSEQPKSGASQNQTEKSVPPTVDTETKSGTRDAPIDIKTADDVLKASQVVAKDPTERQAAAEVFQHGHGTIKHLGLSGKHSISLETGVGDTRKGTAPDGKPWEVKMPVAYGRVKGTKGADGQPLDVFIGAHPNSHHVFIIDQHHAGGAGKFDEHKIMTGFRNPIEALHAYANSYTDGGADRVGHVTALSADEFKDWLKNGDHTKPFKPDAAKPKQSRPGSTEPQNLLQFLASKGGLKSHPELEALDAHKHLVQMSGWPPRRKLVRDDGMDLDRAREAAEEAGYLQGEHNKTSTVRDLLDAIDDGLRAKHTQAQGEEDHTPRRRRALDAEREAHDKLRDEETYGDAREAIKAAGHTDLQTEVLDRAARLMVEEGETDPDTAVDHAIAQLDHEEGMTADRIDGIFGDGAYDEIYPEPAHAGGGRDAPAVHADEGPGGAQAADGPRGDAPQAGGQGEQGQAEEVTGKPLDPTTKYEPVAKGNPTKIKAERKKAPDPEIVPLTLDLEQFKEITDEWADLFADPDEKVITAHNAGPFIPLAEAQKRIDEWREHARSQADGPNFQSNSGKTILSLFDYSGEWSRPWAEAGYNVLTFDIQHGLDVHDFSVEYFNENWDISDVYGILAACPCTEFAVSGARHFAAKDADGRTEKAKELVFQTLRTIEYFRPKFWALENPVSRIESLTGLPKARMTFDPSHFGAPYTKKSLLWGKFNANLPTANVDPIEGSKMHSQYGGKSQATKNARSETPTGFAYAFFMANNYADLTPQQRLNGDYPEVSGAVEAALKAGVTETRIRELMDDTYDNLEYDDARDALIREVAGLKQKPKDEAGADGKAQTVLPGAEKIGQGEQAQRKADAPLKPKVAQKPADGGLFSDDRNQTDLLDFIQPSAAHHAAIDDALSGVGEDPDDVLPVDKARAAELLANNEGMDPATAFGQATAENLVQQNLITQQQAEQAYGPEINAVLDAASQGASGSGAPSEEGGTGTGRERVARSPEEAGVTASSGEAGEAEDDQAAAAGGDTGTGAAVRTTARGSEAAGDQAGDTAENWTAAENADNPNVATEKSVADLLADVLDEEFAAPAPKAAPRPRAAAKPTAHATPLNDDFGNYSVPTGAQLVSASDRPLAPAPKFEADTSRKRTLSLNRQRVWLIDEATKEADANGDGAMARMFGGMDPKNFSRSDFDTVNDYLFGDLDGPVEKNFSAPRPAGMDRDAATKGIMALFGKKPNPDAALKKWFGDSKVVDEAGKPRVMYHGTPNHEHKTGKMGDFDVFDRLAAPRLLPKKPGYDSVGSWFSDRADDKGAGAYAGGDTAERGSIYPVYLSIKNPWRPESFDEFLDKMHKQAKTGLTIKKAREKNIPPGLVDPEPLRTWLKKNGYDGIAFNKGDVDMKEQSVWIALEPNQIKSAIGNSGRFDPDDPSILAEPEPVFVDFDEDLYQRALPFFKAGAASFANETNDLKEQIRGLVRHLNKAGMSPDEIRGMSPYIVRFVEDVTSGKESIQDERARTDDADPETLGGVSAEEGAGTSGGRGTERRGPRGGDVDAGRDRSPDEAGVSGTRGAGSGAPDVHTAAGGTGRGRRAGSRTGRHGSRVSKKNGGDERSGRGPSSEVTPAEAPNLPAVNFRITDELNLGQGSETQKYNDNIAAITALKNIERENRRATAEEQRQLARYVGWGGLANAFRNPEGELKPDWKARGEELETLLTKPELTAARRSTRNAHYTSKTVIDAMWGAAQRLGFRGGLALELSSGSGNFLGLVPDDIAGKTRFIAVEFDSLTARIAKALYPQETVLHSGLQKVPLPDGEAVLNIGNPPFGSESLRFQYKPELAGLSIHNQFFIAGLDALRPRGVQIMVVSRYLMDAQNTQAREMIAERAKLLGAIRLPDTAFKENARTEVVTDILFLQRHTPAEQKEIQQIFEGARQPGKSDSARRAREMAAEKIPEWVNTTAIRDPLGGENMVVNEYFVSHPSMVMGEMDRSGSMRGKDEVNVRLPKDADLGAMLRRAVATLPREVMDYENDVLDASLKRHESMSQSLVIALAGHENGHVEIDRDGRLTQVTERETPSGGYEPIKRTITPKSPWSRELAMDSAGNWYKLEAKLDDKGAKVKAGKKNVYERKYYPNNEVPGGLQLGQAKYDRLREIVALRDQVKAQLTLEAEDAPKAEMEANRKKLAATYNKFVKDNGLLNAAANTPLINDLPDGALVLALESNYRAPLTHKQALRTGEKARPASAQPAPIMSRRVLVKYEPPGTAASPQDALFISLSERGRPDIDRIAQLLGKTPDETAAELTSGATPLLYKDPETGNYETRDTYLSGNVARKLNAAKEAGLETNAKALEKVQPERWTAENVTALLASNWIPTDVYQDFATHLFGVPAKVHYSNATNAFALYVDDYPDSKIDEWGTPDMPPDNILRGMLNSQVPKVKGHDSDGKPYIDHELSALVALKAKEIENAFADWVFADGDRRNRLVDIYNEKFNTVVNRQHDGTHLTLPGKVPDEVIKLRRHQKNAVWRGIYERFMLLDHVVGAGKTFTAIARAMERRRMGLSRKPMIAVPNHLVNQWASDVYRLYPGAKVLAAGSNQFNKKNRRRLFAKVATGDYDIIIVPHSSFGFIGIAPETETRFLEEELRLAIEAVKEAQEQAAADGIGGRSKPITVKEAEALVTKLETRLAGLRGQRRDNMLTFEQMGVDDLTVDEAHEFKNLFYTSKLTGVRGMGNKAGSQKAFDLYSKVRVLRESPTGTVTFMTGTPISNSAVEMYSMMRYLAADRLKELGLENFDAWRTQSVSATSKFEPTEAGGLKEVTRLGRSWSNMRALMGIYYSFTDSVPQEDITKWYAEDNNGARFPVPKVKHGGRKEVVVKPTAAQTAQLTDIIAGFNSLPGISDPYERNKTRLRLMDRARKVSLDVRAADPTSSSQEVGGKLDQIADNVARIYKATAADAGTQLVFLDRSVPSAKGDAKLIKEYDDLIARRAEAETAGDEKLYREIVERLDDFDGNEIDTMKAAARGGWNAYNQLKKNLIKRGVKADEIRFVQEANSDAEKKAMFAAVNDGSVRVLIGSTPRMGAGTNVQERLVALHHGDVTWKPSDIEQREGRIIRFGNMLLVKYGDTFEVEILAYATERTIDSKMWDLNSEKLKMINGIRKYDGAFNMEFEDDDSVGMAEIAALASGDPLLLERVKILSEIDKLELLERAHRRKMFGIDDAIKDLERAQKDYPRRIETGRAKAAVLSDAVDDMIERIGKRSVTIAGKKYGTNDAREAIVLDAAEALSISRDGIEEGKPGGGIDIEGQKITSLAGINDALNKHLGSGIEAVIDGKTVISHSAIAGAIAKKATEAFANTDDDTINGKLGTMLGFDFDMYVSTRGNTKGTIGLTLSRDGKVLVETESNVEDITKPIHTNTGHAALNKLAVEVRNESQFTGAWMQGKIDEAATRLPSLRDQAGKPFAKLDEISAKRDRLAEIIRTLDSRTKAEEGRGVATADEPDESLREDAPAYAPEPAKPPAPANETPDQIMDRLMRQFMAPKEDKVELEEGRGVRRGLGAAGQDFVLAQGYATGNEWLVVYDKKGKEVARYTSNKPNSVTLTPELQVEMHNPANELVMHHNHPQGLSFSVYDFRVLGYLGMSAIWAHGHNGNTYRASLTPAAKDALRELARVMKDQNAPVRRMTLVAQTAENRIVATLQQAVYDGRIDLPTGDRLYSHFASLILREAGIVHYDTNFDAAAYFDQIPGLFETIKTAAKLARNGVFGAQGPARHHDGRPEPVRQRGDLGAILGRTASDARLQVQKGADRAGQTVHRSREAFRSPAEDKGVGGKQPRLLEPDAELAQPRNPFTAPGVGSFDNSLNDVLGRRVLGKLGDWNATEARVQVQDRFLRVKMAEDSLPTPTPTALSTYQAESLYYGKTGYRLEQLDRQHLDPLMAAMKARGVTLVDLDKYLMARHAVERNLAVGALHPATSDFNKAINDPDIKGASGLSKNDARGILAAFAPRRADFTALAARVDALTHNTRRALFDSGLITREQYDALNSKYRWYVPLRGFAVGTDYDEGPRSGSGMDVRGKESKRALGRKSEADSPLAYTMMQAQGAIVRGEKNAVGNVFLKFVLANPDPDRWTVNRPKMIPTVSKTTGLVTMVEDNLALNADNVFATKVNGKVVHITLHGPDGLNLARALKNMGTANVHQLVRTLSSVTHTMAKLSTAWNPEFILPNLARDVGEAGINLQAQDQPGFKRNFAKHLLSGLTIRGSAAAIAGQTPAPGSALARYVDAFHRYDAAGGRVRFFGLDDATDVKGSVEAKLDRLKGGAINTAKDIGDTIGAGFEAVNGGIENATRLAAFMAAEDMGFSQRDAAMLALNLTVNFTKKGELGGVISSLYMFGNAAIQGNARNLQAMQNKKVRRALYALAALGAATALLAALGGGDDEAGKPLYLKIPPWERDKNLIVMLPNGYYVKVPTPFLYGAFPVFGAQAMMVAMGHQKVGKAIGVVMSSIIDSLNPFGQEDIWSTGVLPSMLRPAAHILTNKNWTGRPLFPDEKPWTKGLPDASQSFRSDSAFSKSAAKKLNEWTGGSPYKAGDSMFSVDVHPATIDHMLQTVTGGVGRFGKGLVDSIISGVRDGEWKVEETPILRRFIGRVGPKADQAAFYEAQKAEQDRQVAIAKARKDLGGPNAEQAREFIKGNPPGVAKGAFDAANRQIKQQRKAEDRVNSDASLSGADRAARIRDIERRIQEIQNRARKTVNDRATAP